MIPFLIAVFQRDVHTSDLVPADQTHMLWRSLQRTVVFCLAYSTALHEVSNRKEEYKIEWDEVSVRWDKMRYVMLYLDKEIWFWLYRSQGTGHSVLGRGCGCGGTKLWRLPIATSVWSNCLKAKEYSHKIKKKKEQYRSGHNPFAWFGVPVVRDEGIKFVGNSIFLKELSSLVSFIPHRRSFVHPCYV